MTLPRNRWLRTSPLALLAATALAIAAPAPAAAQTKLLRFPDI